jgi:hypothetical protein
LVIAGYLSLLGYGLWWNITDSEGSAGGAILLVCVWLCAVPLAAAFAWRRWRHRAASRDALLRGIALTLIATSIPLMMLMSLLAVATTGI